MDFSEALHAIKDGKKATREGWNGPGQWVALHPSNTHDDVMTRPFLYIHTVQGDDVPWLGSQTDLLAEDWQLVQR